MPRKQGASLSALARASKEKRISPAQGLEKKRSARDIKNTNSCFETNENATKTKLVDVGN